ncbi:rap guanine nucleotide exchange factor 2-like isoform X2 [Paramacrobiotus metropolitanus]|uniref:rap guanine nucleotide exchange factor 2-like isoform X2 n=1 Tax=Paramacrobiotus metropolitanus TaxID=2943436 RepID=UPI0024464843|nr:rap guanine nucleotide exchange factor 2-like isoform X2 [Paramacrobiotus metropolitanus]
MEDDSRDVHPGYATLRRWRGIHERRKALQRSTSVSFGKRYGNTTVRTDECLVLEPSEIIAIDYPDVAMVRHRNTTSTTTAGGTGPMTTAPVRVKTRERLLSDNSVPMGGERERDLLSSASSSNLPCDRLSHGSDTSSGAYSAASDLPISHRHDSMAETDSEDEVDLIEDMPDGEESISASSCTFRDTVREFLDKDPLDRSEDEIEYLLDFMQRLPAFASYTQSIKRLLCQVMRFAYVKDAGCIVMSDGEELDSWSVIINGSVQIEFPDGEIEELNVGDSFGITPTMEKLYHRGIMRTKTEDCQFIIVAQQDYYNILNQTENLTRKIVDEEGRVVMMVENRILDASGRRGPVVIKATAERLINYLAEEHSVSDPYYIEDFLLTYRTFLTSPTEVSDQLKQWYADPLLRDRATRIVLLWVNSHFIDFESHPDLIGFLDWFQLSLESHKKIPQLKMLHKAFEVKPRTRNITLTRSTREESLNFSILGGWDRGFGIYVCDVKKASKGEELGLRKGDQILQVNGVRFEHINHSRALEVLRKATHLSISVKSNLLGYREMLSTPADASPRHRSRYHRSQQSADVVVVGAHNRLSSCDLDGLELEHVATSPALLVLPATPSPPQQQQPVLNANGETKKGFMTLRPKSGLRKALMKMNIISRDLPREYMEENTTYQAISTDPTGGALSAPKSGKLQHSRSNPDLLAAAPHEEVVTVKTVSSTSQEFPDHVIKVYRPDQIYKYLLVHKETTVREIVMLALNEFGITETSHNYSLYQVSVEAQNVIIQRRLPDEMQGLADSLPLNARIYLKNLHLQETLVADDVAPEIWRESQISVLQLDAHEIAAQLTLQDFSVFKQIEPTEFIDDLFGRYSPPSAPSTLRQFEGVVNREMFWVVTEVCSESNINKRARLLKLFIKIAKYCHEARNLNSCFAILSGLSHGCVYRLKSTWEKVPQKHLKTRDTLSNLMDPSRNMSKYRHLLLKWSATPPLIPFYPIVRKDLTFLHEGNETSDGQLINFEKLRMISKEIRQLKAYTSVPYDLHEVFDGACAPRNHAFNTMVGTAHTAKKTHGSRSLPTRKKVAVGLSVSAKKLYEEAQMVRKVKQYWNNVKITENEAELQEKSLACEPSTASVVKRQTSAPEPMHFAVGPKFGQQSPQAVRKLMALSDSSKMRTHHGRNAGGGGGGHHHPSRSPATSPKPPMNRGYHARMQADMVSFGHTLKPPYAHGAMIPVDLSVESSSVTALVGSGMALRKSQSGSVTSSDSVAGHSVADSGLASSSLDSCPSSVNSSPSLNRPPSPPPLQSATTAPPPIPPARNSRNAMLPPQLPPRDGLSYIRPRASRPPDYEAATQARSKPTVYSSSVPAPPPPGGSAQLLNNIVVSTLRRPPLIDVTGDNDGTASTV